MALGTSANVAIAYVDEAGVWGTTPATPTMLELRVKEEDVTLNKTGLVSEEIKGHRQIANVTHGQHTVEGTLGMEFNNCFDDWLEAALWGELTGGVIKLGQFTKSFTLERRMINVGQFFQYKGIRANGLTLELVPDTIAQMTIPVMGRTLPTPTINALGSPSGWLVDNVAGYAVGTTSMAINTGTGNFAAGDQFVIYQAASAVLQRSAQIYTASAGDATTVTFTPGLDVAILDNDILHAVRPATVVTSDDPMLSNGGTLSEGGSSFAVATRIQLTIDQGLEAAQVIGSNLYSDIIAGPAKVTGQLDAYILNSALFSKFVSETYSTLQFVLSNSANTYTWLLPKIKYTGAQLGKAADGRLMQVNMPFEGVYDSSEATAVKVTKS